MATWTNQNAIKLGSSIGLSLPAYNKITYWSTSSSVSITMTNNTSSSKSIMLYLANDDLSKKAYITSVNAPANARQTFYLPTSKSLLLENVSSSTMPVYIKLLDTATNQAPTGISLNGSTQIPIGKLTLTYSTITRTLTTAVSPSGYGTVTEGGSIAYNSTKSLTATPNSGYKFSSWSKTAGTLSSTTTNPTTFTMGTSDATVTANFAKQSYTLTTAVSPSGGGTVTSGGSIEYQGTKSLTATPATGYNFSSWSKTAGTLSSTTTNPTTFTMGAGNATVTANFTVNSYTLTTTVSPSGGGTVTAGGSIAYNGTKSLTATPAEGYSFSSWSKTAGTLSSTTTNPTTFTMGAGNATVTANFTVNSYTLTTTVSPSGYGTVTEGGSIAYNSTKSLTATPEEGYEFSSWSTTSGTLSSTTANPTTFTMGTSDATVTANFVKKSYTLTTAVSPSGGGTVTSGGSIVYQDTESLTATPAAGYSFSYWSTTSGTLSSTTTNPTTFTMGTSDATVTANFIKQYVLSTMVSPSGGGTVTAGGYAQYGDSVQLTATPSTGYLFDKWIVGGGVIDNPYASTAIFTMPDADVSVYAVFKEPENVLVSGRYNGSSYDAVIPMRYNGASWDECNIERYNGSSWDNVDML